jgi:hypothetical protein
LGVFTNSINGGILFIHNSIECFLFEKFLKEETYMIKRYGERKLLKYNVFGKEGNRKDGI